MSATIFENQRLELTLNCKTDAGEVFDLTDETGNVRLLILKPDNTEVTVTPSIPDAANGVITHTFAVDYLAAGQWAVKAYLLTQQIPGTIFGFIVYGKWQK